ncbi:MAG: tetraacyldisaccharide 4'-kinase [Planctomycetota bacterium]
MNQQAYRRLISDQTVGIAPALLRYLLRVASCFYLGCVVMRNLLYSRGWLKTHRVNAIVISIGNITTGGTGKTPLVIWLYNLLSEKGIPCAILTRGYKTTQSSALKTQNYTDEPAILAGNCPNAQVIINPDRVAAAGQALEKSGAKVLIMDDGFQHRRLHRDLDIVTIDATTPFGYGKFLPRGLLREPLTALKRAHAAVITRCEQVSESELTQIEKKLRQFNPDMIIARSTHTAVSVKSAADTELGLDEFKNKKVFAFCGIANPDAFLNTIKGLGAHLVGSGTYNDHHQYTRSDIAHICQQAGHLGAELVLSTEKDWAKITQFFPLDQSMPFAYLAIQLRFTRGASDAAGSQVKITQLIEKTLAGKILRN